MGILSTTTEVSARASRQTPSFERLLGGSLGASLGVLGGPRGVPGWSLGVPGGSLGGPWGVPGGSLGFLGRSLGVFGGLGRSLWDVLWAKCCCGFSHKHVFKRALGGMLCHVWSSWARYMRKCCCGFSQKHIFQKHLGAPCGPIFENVAVAVARSIFSRGASISRPAVS